MNTHEQNKISQNEEKTVYEKPEIEIIEMEHEGSILAYSDNSGGWMD